MSSGRVLYARAAAAGSIAVAPANVGAMNDMLNAALVNGTGRRAGFLLPSGRRQDRHHPGFPRCLVHRLHRAPGGRRVGRQRPGPHHEQRARRQPAGGHLAADHVDRARGPRRRRAARHRQCREPLPVREPDAAVQKSQPRRRAPCVTTIAPTTATVLPHSRPMMPSQPIADDFIARAAGRRRRRPMPVAQPASRRAACVADASRRRG